MIIIHAAELEPAEIVVAATAEVVLVAVTAATVVPSASCTGSFLNSSSSHAPDVDKVYPELHLAQVVALVDEQVAQFATVQGDTDTVKVW